VGNVVIIMDDVVVVVIIIGYDRINVVPFKHSSASGPRYKVSVTDVVSVRKSRKTDTSSAQYGMMSRLALT